MLSTREVNEVKKLKPKDTIKIVVKDKISVYDVSNSPTFQAVPLYSIDKGALPNSDVMFTVVDNSFSLQRGTNEICVAPLKDNEKALKKKFGRVEELVKEKEGRLGERIDGYNMKEVFTLLKEKQIPWKRVLDFLIDDTGIKDERLKALVASHCLGLPVDEPARWQMYNNHSICLTNTGTAKTTSYTRVGFPPSSDYSIPGLIGTIGQNNEVKMGDLNGAGTAVMDEFTEQRNVHNNEIINHLLDYMENGQTKRSLQYTIECKGTKALVFLGNCSDLNPRADEFRREIIKIATTDSLSRIGRRFAHVFFGNNYKPVQPCDYDPQTLVFLRLMLQSALNQNAIKIKLILESGLSWVGQKDEEYEKEVGSYMKYCSSRQITEFLNGCKRSYSRLKMGALKKAIVENLDVITFEKGYKKAFEAVLPEAEMNYALFKKWNLESFSYFTDNKRRVFEKMFNEGYPKEIIYGKVGVSIQTYYDWVKEMGLEKSEVPVSAEKEPKIT